MARTFRRQRTMQPISELNLTNMIDLGFVLLIIFMIALTVIKEEQTLPIDLPVASKSSQDKSPDTKFETVIIRANGTYEMGGRALKLSDLGRELTNFANLDTPPVIRVRSDKAATAQMILDLMNEVTRHGLNRLSIDYKVVD